MTKLIGLTGPAGCGKDTIGERLMAVHGFAPMAFANPLRLAAAEAFGIDYWEFTDRVLKDQVHPYWGLTRRQMLQRMGTEAMRGAFGEDFWIRRWTMTYLALSESSNVVVTDVRFVNEADAIRAQGGVIVHVSRPNLPNLEGNHASAQGVGRQHGDLVLRNDHDIKGLYAKVDKMAKTLGADDVC